MRLRFHPGWCLFLVLANALPAQLPQGGWALATRVYWEVDDTSWSGQAGLLGAGTYSIAIDELGRIFTFDSARGVNQYAFTPPSLSTVARLAVLQGGWVFVDRSHVWAYDAFGLRIGSLAKGTPLQTPNWLPGTIPGGVGPETFDGRTLYYTVPVNASYPYHVYAIDLTASPIAARPILQLPLSAYERRDRPIAIGPDGKLLVMDNTLLLVDPVTGAATTISQPPNNPSWLNGYGDVRGMVMAYDPWTSTVALGLKDINSSMVYTQVLGTGIWTLQRYFPFEGLLELASNSERPFELFGRGCANALGRDPRLGWRGLPVQGQAFDVTLRDAEPNGFALFWLGISDQSWSGVGSLPFDAAPMGAPGCLLRVSPDVTYPAWVDSAGKAAVTLSVPVNPALQGLEVFSQSASSSGANLLGFAASDALVIRVR
jgi:hypothetical protein